MAIATGTGLLLAGAAGLAGSAISANKQKKAIESSTQMQIDAANQAFEVQRQSEAEQVARLDPFTQFGQGFIPQAQQAITESGQLFQPGAVQSVIGSDQFGAISEDVTNKLLARQAATGRSATGDTATTLQRGLLGEAQGILASERNAALSRNQQLMQALGIGQSSAAGQAAAIGQSGQIQGGLLTDIGAVGAAGEVGKANVSSQAIQNALGLIPFFTSGGGGTENTLGGGSASPMGFGGA